MTKGERIGFGKLGTIDIRDDGFTCVVCHKESPLVIEIDNSGSEYSPAWICLRCWLWIAHEAMTS